MSVLKPANFSNGKWIREVSLSCGVDDSKKRKIDPFRNDGTSIVVSNLPQTITAEQLKQFTDGCLEVKIVNLDERVIERWDGTLATLPAKTFAYLRFASKDKANFAVIALQERTFGDMISKAVIKKSKWELEKEREAIREERREARRLERLREIAELKEERKERKRLERIALRKQQEQERREHAKKETKLDEVKSTIITPTIQDTYNGYKQDWFCPKCKTLNFFPRDTCLKCKFTFVAPEPEHIKERRKERERKN
jgi:RNA recognition motif-containing protein